MNLFKNKKQTRTIDTGNAEVKVPMDGTEPSSYSLYQASVDHFFLRESLDSDPNYRPVPSQCVPPCTGVNLLRAVSTIKKR